VGLILNEAEFGRLLATFEQTAFRLELQPTYTEEFENAWLARWLAGDRTPPTEVPEMAAWFEQLRALTAEGRTMTRVRVQDEPPTAYQRWENWVGIWNRAAGEHLRRMTRAKAHDVGLLPAAGENDWWLLDNSRLIVMTFDADGRRILSELVEDADAVDQACMWRDLAINHSVPDDDTVAGA